MTNASNLLPWHPRRLDDEILSSWMLRIASGNGISVRSLCAWLGLDDDWVRGIDSMDPYNPLVNHIAEAAGVEKEIVIKSLPSGLYGLFGESISSTDWSWNTQWRLLGGTPPNNLGNQYCPICLRKFGHYQLSWTIAVYSCCLQHKCFLREHCPHCGKTFLGAARFFDSCTANPKRDLQLCAYCGRSVVNHEPYELADEKTLKLTYMLDSLVRNPACVDYFEVLARLLHVMCRPSALAKHMRSQMLPESHQITSRYWSGTPHNFEYLDVKSRAFMLQAVVSLFADWPDYLVDVLRSTNDLHHLHHLFKNKSLPNWYESAVRIAATRNRCPKPSDREQFLHTAIQQGWVTAVQFAKKTRDSRRFLHLESA